MKNAVSLLVVLFLTWLLLSGHYTPLLIAFGVVSCALVVLITWRMDVVDNEGVPVHLTPRLWTYLPWLAWQVILSNLHVARVVLSPSLPVSRRVIRVPTGQRTALAQVIYANSITMTPGTVSIEIIGKTITVHALTRGSAEGVETGEMDRRVTRVEGLG